MTLLLLIAVAAAAVWLAVTLWHWPRRGGGDATADFSRALAAIAPADARRRRVRRASGRRARPGAPGRPGSAGPSVRRPSTPERRPTPVGARRSRR